MAVASLAVAAVVAGRMGTNCLQYFSVLFDMFYPVREAVVEYAAIGAALRTCFVHM